MKVKQLLALAVSQIKSDTAALDAEILLTYVLDKNRTWLATWPEYEVPQDLLENYLQLVKRRVGGEPIAYIVGERDFWTLTLNTDSSTLIPRPETELLVEQALAVLAPIRQAKILDLGTGTGAIALAIASERPQDSVFACDFNAAAVSLARANAKKNNIRNIDIFESDWFERVAETEFDLILSNPPYVAEGDPHLQQGDLVFEPNTALIAKQDGFADIKLICEQATGYLKADGALMFEHGFEQGEIAREIMIGNGYTQVNTVQDLAGLDRLTQGKYHAYR